MVAREVIESIRERADIVEVVSQRVSLKRRGNSFVGLCPFHDEKTPSFHVVPQKSIFHCFGCRENGDVFKFVMKTRGVSFMEAVKEVGTATGIDVPEEDLTPDERRRIQARTDLYGVCEEACRWFQSALLTRPEGRPVLAYLRGRGLADATIEAWRLGFAPDAWSGLLDHLHGKGIDVELAVRAGLAKWRDESGDRRRGAYDFIRGRVIVPIEDARGRVVAFAGRELESRPGSPKYLNSPGTEIYDKSKTLYGLSRARARIQRLDRVLLVEGYFDVISLHQAGFAEAVAVCGAALSQDQTGLLRRLCGTLVAQLDEDEAGVRGAVDSMNLCLDAGMEARRLDLGDAKDPDEYIRSHGDRGHDAFEELLARSRPLFDLVLDHAVERHGTTPGGRERTLGELAPIVRRFAPASREVVIGRVAGALGIPEEVVRERVGRGVQAPAPAEGPVSESDRWTGSAHLNHLFWLLIHHADVVTPALRELDFEVDAVTDRPEARRALRTLMEGRALADVLDANPDSDVARVLGAAAAKEDLYSAETASDAAREIALRLRLAGVDTELSRSSRELSACATSGDRSSYVRLARERQDLQHRRRQILQSLTERRGR